MSALSRGEEFQWFSGREKRHSEQRRVGGRRQILNEARESVRVSRAFCLVFSHLMKHSRHKLWKQRRRIEKVVWLHHEAGPHDVRLPYPTAVDNLSVLVPHQVMNAPVVPDNYIGI